MEGHCWTGQSPQWAVVPMEEEDERVYGEIFTLLRFFAASFSSVLPNKTPADTAQDVRRAKNAFTPRRKFINSQDTFQ
jgi:hypothetical protein